MSTDPKQSDPELLKQPAADPMQAAAPRLDTGIDARIDTGIDPAAVVYPDIEEPRLEVRLDPAQVIIDWDVTGLVSDESGVDGQFSRPKRSEFVRAHPTWSTGCYLLDCRSNQGLNAEYVLSRPVAAFLIRAEEPVQACKIFLLAIHGGGYRFWPIKLGDAGEVRTPSQHVTTAIQAVEAARAGWRKIFWRNTAAKSGWAHRAARTQLPDPTWPADPTALFLEAIADRFIDTATNPVVKAYLGEV